MVYVDVLSIGGVLATGIQLGSHYKLMIEWYKYSTLPVAPFQAT